MLPSTVLQKKTFTKWANSKLATLDEPQYLIQDLESDLRDGHRLLALVRVLVKKTNMATTNLVPEKHHQRIHHIINVGKALKCIELCTRMPLPNIGSEDIVDGNLKLTLGLIWLLILRFQITQIADLNIASKPGTIHDVMSDDELKMVSATQDVMPQKLVEVQFHQQLQQKEQLQQQPQQQGLQLQEPQKLEQQEQQQQQPQTRQQEQVRLQEEEEKQQQVQQAQLQPQLQQQQEQRQQQENQLQQEMLQQEQKQKQQDSTKVVQSTSRTQKTERKVQQTKTVDVQVQLLQWTKDRLSKIRPKANLPTNFGKAWQDGQHFCLLVHGYAPTHLRLSQVRPLNDNKEDWKFNLDLAFGVAEHHLRIPTLLDPEDLVNYADEKSIMTYLSGFCELPAPLTPPPEFVPDEVKPAEVQLTIDTKDSNQVQVEITKPASPNIDSGLNNTPSTVNASAPFQGELQPAVPLPQFAAQPAAQALLSAVQPASPKRFSFLSRVISGPSSSISTLTSYAASFVLPKSSVTTESSTQSTDSTPSSPSKGTLFDAGTTRLAPESVSAVVDTAPAPTPAPDLSLSQTVSSASLNPSLTRKPSFTESIASYVAIFSPSRQVSILEDTPAAQDAVPEPAPKHVQKPMLKPAPKETLNASASVSSWSGYFSSFLSSRSSAQSAGKELETDPTNQELSAASVRVTSSGETNVDTTEISQTRSNVTGSHAREILVDTQAEEKTQGDEKRSALTKVESVQTIQNEHGVIVTTITTSHTTTTTVSQNQEYASRTEVQEVHSSTQESQIHGGEIQNTQSVIETSVVDQGMNVTTKMGVQIGAEVIKSETREMPTSLELRTDPTFQQVLCVEADGTVTATVSNRSEQELVVSSMSHDEIDLRKRMTFPFFQKGASESHLRTLATSSQTTRIQSEESSVTYRRSESAHSEQRTITASVMPVQASGEATKVLQTTDYGSQSYLHGLVTSSQDTRIQSKESQVTVLRSESVQSEQRTTLASAKTVKATDETVKVLQTLESESQSQSRRHPTPSKPTHILGEVVSGTAHRYQGAESVQTTVVKSTMVTESRLEEVKVSEKSETNSSLQLHKEFTYQQPMLKDAQSSALDNEGGSAQSTRGIAFHGSMVADPYKHTENVFVDQDIGSQSCLRQALVTSQESRIDNSRGHEAITIVGSSQICERTETTTKELLRVVKSETTVDASKDQSRGSKHQEATLATQGFSGDAHPSVDQQALRLNAAREMTESHQIGQAQRGIDEMSMLRSVADKKNRKSFEDYKNVSFSQLREGLVQPQLPHTQVDAFSKMGDESHLSVRKEEEQRARCEIVGKEKTQAQSSAKDREGEPSLESSKILSPTQPSQFSEEQKLINFGDGYGQKDQAEPQMGNKSVLVAITESMKGNRNEQNASRFKINEGIIKPQASQSRGDEDETESSRKQQNWQQIGLKSMVAAGADKKAATVVQNKDESQSQLGGFVVSPTQTSQPQNDKVGAAISREPAGPLEEVIASIKNFENDQQGKGARQTSAVPVQVNKDPTRALVDRELLPSSPFRETSPNRKAPVQWVEHKVNIEVTSGLFDQKALGVGPSREMIARENLENKHETRLHEQLSAHPLHPGLAHLLVSVKRDETNDKKNHLESGQIDQSKPETASEGQMSTRSGEETNVRSMREPNSTLQRHDVLSPTQASQDDGDKSNAIVGEAESCRVERSEKEISFGRTSGISQGRYAKKIPRDPNHTRPDALVGEFGENTNVLEADSLPSDNEEENKTVKEIKAPDSDNKKGKFHENQELPKSTQLHDELLCPHVAVRRGADVTAEKPSSYHDDQVQPVMDFQDLAIPFNAKKGEERPTDLECGSSIQLPEGLSRPQVATKREGTYVAAGKHPSYLGHQIQPIMDFQDSAIPFKDKKGEETPTSRERGPSVQLQEGVPHSQVFFQRDKEGATAQKPPSYQGGQMQPEGQLATSSIGFDEKKDKEKPKNREPQTSTRLREGLDRSPVSIQRDETDETAQKAPTYGEDQLNLGIQLENSGIIAADGVDEKTLTNRKPETSIQLRGGYSGLQEEFQRDEGDMSPQIQPSYQAYHLQPSIDFATTSVGKEVKKSQEKTTIPERTASIHLHDNFAHSQVSVEKAASDAAHQKRPSYQDDQMHSGGQGAPSSIGAGVNHGGETPTNKETQSSVPPPLGLPLPQLTAARRDETDGTLHKRPSYQRDQLQPGVQLEGPIMAPGDNKDKEIPTNRERGASIQIRESLAGPQVSILRGEADVHLQKGPSYQGAQMQPGTQFEVSSTVSGDSMDNETPSNGKRESLTRLREDFDRSQVSSQRDGADAITQRGPSHQVGQMQPGMQFKELSTVAQDNKDDEKPTNRVRGSSIQLHEELPCTHMAVQRDSVNTTPLKGPSYHADQMQPELQSTTSSIGTENSKVDEAAEKRKRAALTQLRDGLALDQAHVNQNGADSTRQKRPSYQGDKPQPGIDLVSHLSVDESKKGDETSANREHEALIQLPDSHFRPQVELQSNGGDVSAFKRPSYQIHELQSAGQISTSSAGTEGIKNEETSTNRERGFSIQQRGALPPQMKAVQRDGSDATRLEWPSYQDDQIQLGPQLSISSIGAEEKKGEEAPAIKERSASIQLRENLSRSPPTPVQRDETDAIYQKQTSYQTEQMQPGGQFSTSLVGAEDQKADEKPKNSNRASSIQLGAGIPYLQESGADGANIVDKPEPRHGKGKQREISEVKNPTAVEDHREIKAPMNRDNLTPSQMLDGLVTLQKPTIDQTNLAVKEGGSNESKQLLDTEIVVCLQENIEGTKPYKYQDMSPSSEARKDPQLAFRGPDTNEKATPMQSVRKESRIGFGNIMSMIQAGIKGLTAYKNEENISPSQLRGESTYPQASVIDDKATTESTNGSPGLVDQNDQKLGRQGVMDAEGDKARDSEPKNQENLSLRFGPDLAEHLQVSRQPDAQCNTDRSIQFCQEEQGVDFERTIADELQKGQEIFKNQEITSPPQLREICNPSEEPLLKGKKSKAKGSQDVFCEKNQRNEKLEAKSIVVDDANKNGSKLSNNQKKTSLPQQNNIPLQTSTYPEAKPAQRDISDSLLEQGLGVKPSAISSKENEKVRNVSNNQDTTLPQLGGFFPPSQVSSNEGDKVVSISRQHKSDSMSSKQQRRDSESSMGAKAGKQTLKAAKDEVSPSTQVHGALVPSQELPFEGAESVPSTHQNETSPSDRNEKPSDLEGSRDAKAGKKNLKASKGQENAASQLRDVLIPFQASPYKEAESVDAAHQHESGQSDSNEQLCEPEGNGDVKADKKKQNVLKGKKNPLTQLHDVLAPVQVSLQSQFGSSETDRQHESGKSDSNEQLSHTKRSKSTKAGKKRLKASNDQGSAVSQLRDDPVPSQATPYDAVETSSGTHQDQPTDSHTRDLRFNSDSGRDAAEKERTKSMRNHDTDSRLRGILASSNESLDTRDSTTAAPRMFEPRQSEVKNPRLESCSDKNVKEGKKRSKPRKYQEDTDHIRDTDIPSEPTPPSNAEVVPGAREYNPILLSSSEQQMGSSGNSRSDRKTLKASKGQRASSQSSRDVAPVLSSSPQGIEASMTAHQHDPRQSDAKEEQIGSDSIMDIEIDKQNSILNEQVGNLSQSRGLHVPSQVAPLNKAPSKPENPKSKESRSSLGGSRDVKPRKKSQETFKDQKGAGSPMRDIIGPSRVSIQGDEAASAARQLESGQAVSLHHRMGLESSWDVDLNKTPSIVSDYPMGISSQMRGVTSLSQASAQGDEAASIVRHLESGQAISKQHRMGLESSWDVDLDKGTFNILNDQIDDLSQIREVAGPSRASAQRDEADSTGSQHEPGQTDSKRHQMGLETTSGVIADKVWPKVSNVQDCASSQWPDVLNPSHASARLDEAVSATRQLDPGLSPSQKQKTGLESIPDAEADKKKAKVHEAAFSQFSKDLVFLQAPLQGPDQNISDINELESRQVKKSTDTEPTIHVHPDLAAVEATKTEENAQVSILKTSLDELQAIPNGQQTHTSTPRNSQSSIREIPPAVRERQPKKSLAQEADLESILMEPGYTDNPFKSSMLRMADESGGIESMPKRVSMSSYIPPVPNQMDKNLAQEDTPQIQNPNLGYPRVPPLVATQRGMANPMDGVNAGIFKLEAIQGECQALATAQIENIRIQMGRVFPSEKTPSKTRSSITHLGSAATPAQTESRTRGQAYASERNDLQRNAPGDAQGMEHQPMDPIQGENCKQQNPLAFNSMGLLSESMKKEDDRFDTNNIAFRGGVQSNIHRSSIEKQPTLPEAETLYPERLREVHTEPPKTPYTTAIQERNASTRGALQQNSESMLRETRPYLENTLRAQGLLKVTLPLPFQPLELRQNFESERQARAKLLTFLEKMNLKLLGSQGMRYVDEYLSDTIPEENAYLGITGDNSLAMAKTTRSYYSLVTEGTQTQIFGLSTFASSGFIESGILSFSEGGQQAAPNEMISHSSSALERATNSNILASISDKGTDSTSSKANEFSFQQSGISTYSFTSIGSTNIASSSRSSSRASPSTAATSMRLKNTHEREQVSLAPFSETVQSPLLTNSALMVSPFGRLSLDSTEEITSEKILVLAIQHLSKQVQLLPSNPASYQVRIELFHHYEIQYRLLVTRSEELGLISSTIIERNLLTRKPEGEVGILLYELQLKLKKESKVLNYERRVHIVIGFGLVIFMTWAFLYLPILDVDAKNDDQCHWN